MSKHVGGWCSGRTLLGSFGGLGWLWLTLLMTAVQHGGVARGGNPDAKRLYDDLLSNYNKLVRPVVNVSEAVTVRLKLKLSQLIDVVRALLFLNLGKSPNMFYFPHSASYKSGSTESVPNVL